MKRIISFLLCLALMLSYVPLITYAADSSHEFKSVNISAGEYYISEKCIVSNGEIYIPATSFSRYTRYEFDVKTNTFLIDGQERRKAFKAVVVEPTVKKLAVRERIVELSDCFTVDGEIYLPLAQMLPILDADILTVDEQGICVVNNKLSMAELFYDFSLSDYVFDYSREFEDNKLLAMLYIMPSYWFSSVTGFRIDRLDAFFKTADYNDYKSVMLSYLKDDDLYREAMEDPDAIADVFQFLDKKVLGKNTVLKNLHGVYDWMDKFYAQTHLNDDLLVQNPILEFVRNSPSTTDGKVERVLDAVYSNKLADLITVADAIRLADYVYTYFNHVEDHKEMLDAVYDVATVLLDATPQEKAAFQVYLLFEKEVPGYGVAVEILEEYAKKKLTHPTYALYKGVAQLSGWLWEFAIPGDTNDVSKLMYHAGIVNDAMVKATPTLDTEKSTESFRLSMLLTMIASRKCYQIMAETAEGHKRDATYYRQKIADIEAIIKGLYLVADNVPYDTYEYYDDHAELALQRIQESGILDQLKPYVGLTEDTYNEFLKTLTDYVYCSVMDVDGDGTAEILATKQPTWDIPADQPYYPILSYVTMFRWVDGRFAEELSFYVKDYLSFQAEKNWLVTFAHGTGGSGTQSFIFKNELSKFCEVDFTWIPEETDDGEISMNGTWSAGYTCDDMTPIHLPDREWFFGELGDFDPYKNQVPFQLISKQTKDPSQKELSETVPAEYRAYLKDCSELSTFWLLDLDGDGNEELMVKDEAGMYATILDHDGKDCVTYGVDAGGTIRYSPEFSWIITRSDSEDGTVSYSIVYKDEIGEYVTAYLTYMPWEVDGRQWELAMYSYSSHPAPSLEWFVQQLSWVEPMAIELPFHKIYT